MTKEGLYLAEQGFIPYLLDQDKSKTHGLAWVQATGEPEFSSMNHIMCLWKKGDMEAVTGLSEKGHPPCLIRPRPLSVFHRDDGTLTFSPWVTDADMDRLIAKYGFAEVLRMGQEQECFHVETLEILRDF